VLGLERAALATAQPAGFPVHLSPAHSRVFGVYADFGASAGWAGSGGMERLGARLRFTTPKIQLLAGVGRVAADAESLHAGVALHGLAALSLGQRTPRRQCLFAGVGWTDLGGAAGTSFAQLDVPIGVGLARYAPAPMGAVELWGAPRLHLRSAQRTALGARARVTRVGLGASAGLSFTRPRTQIGGGLSVDALVIDDPGRGRRFLGAFGISLFYLRANP
jgi:hypothetical protein